MFGNAQWHHEDAHWLRLQAQQLAEESLDIQVAWERARAFTEGMRELHAYTDELEELMLEDLMLEVDVLGGRDGPAMD